MFNEKHILVGGWATPLKNMKVSWDDYSQYMEKQEMFQATNQKVYIQCKKTSFIEQAAGSWGDVAVHFGYNEKFS